MDKDAYYFPHFANARNDRKIRRLRKQLGIEGYGIYFMVLEVLREQQDFSYPLEDVDLLADEFNTSQEKVLAVITNYKLFKVTEDRFFYSPKFYDYMGPYLQKKQSARINGIKGNLIRHHGYTKELLEDKTPEEIIALNTQQTQLLAPDSPPESGSGPNKSKVNKTKVKKIPPDKSEVKAWLVKEKGCTDQQAETVCEEFYSFYDQKGWKVGKTKMVKWKVALGRACKNWESIQKILNGGTANGRGNAGAYQYK
nr:hypothetical protein 22 [bacterium]